MIDLFRVKLQSENDIVSCRQRVRQLAAYLNLDSVHQTQVATAVSEAARNAVRHAGGGMTKFRLQNHEPFALKIEITDVGPGIPDVEQAIHAASHVGLKACLRLMDHFHVNSRVGTGTTVYLTKYLQLPEPLSQSQINMITDNLLKIRGSDEASEIKIQNLELIVTLEELRKQQEIAESYQRRLESLNKELADTNRGVIALNSELEDQAKTVREASEVKSRFLSHVTHEFRTPVNSLLSMGRILLVEGENLTVEQRKQVAFMRQAAEGLSEMVNDLLDTVKAEAHKLTATLSTVDIADIFDTLKALFRPLLPVSGQVELVFEPVQDLPLIVSDETKVSQIVRNFISNALKFTEAGVIRVSCRLADERIIITVEDSGIGIAPEDQERIFEEFYQVMGSHQKRVKGTGLGLSLARKFARLLNGDITVESEKGRGSRFILDLPFQPAGPLVRFDRNKRILIIDDDETAHISLRDLLENYSCDFAFAFNGKEGLKMAETFNPDLIILDLRMPIMDGFEVLKYLKLPVSELAKIPVLLNSSMNLTLDDFSGSDARPDGILSKDAGNRGQDLQTILEALNKESEE